MIAGHREGSTQVDRDALLAKAVARNAELDKQNAELRAQVEVLTQRVNALLEERDKNSRNSNKPPSSDGLGERRNIRKPKKPTGRKKGGQKGHKGHWRRIISAELVNDVVHVLPGPCERCGEARPQSIACAWVVHQVVELLEGGGRHVTEYRLHGGQCLCGELLPLCYTEVPSSSFGPRLKGVVSLLTGNYQLSRRQVVKFVGEMYGIKMSLGTVSNIEGEMANALKRASEEALEHAEGAAVKHIDETSWLHNFDTCSAWVIANAVVSVFRIVANGRRSSLMKILQRKARGILVSDRASVFLFWSMKKRQVCWSHLQRKFISFSERDGPASALGSDLVTCAELVFGYWRQYCAGELSREKFTKWMEAVQKSTREVLERAVNADLEGVSGSCANMLKHWDAMWTFVKTPGVEPTNNHAERELRRLVMWRQRCFGTQSDRGQRFVERMMTVTHTLRKLGRGVLQFLQESFEAMIGNRAAPLLIPAS
jgi:transposase